MAQAIAAAYNTVETRLGHLLHAYFMRPGDPSIPVVYSVDCASDGGSLTTRRVIALQYGKQVLKLSASFHISEEGWQHQHSIPKVAGPDGLTGRHVLRQKNVDTLPKQYRKDYVRPRPIEVRELAPTDHCNPKPAPDLNHLQFRMRHAAGQTPQMQHCLLAYTSDMNLLGSSLRPHGLTWFKGGVMTASLDHAMWFHAPVQFDHWHLHSTDSPFTGGGRDFSRGPIYTQDGALVTSVAQEGLVLPLRTKT